MSLIYKSAVFIPKIPTVCAKGPQKNQRRFSALIKAGKDKKDGVK